MKRLFTLTLCCLFFAWTWGTGASGQTPFFTLLHTFQGYPSEASAPKGSLIQATDGNLYGTTSSGVPTVFKMTPSGSLTYLIGFTTQDGAPYAGLVQGTDGNFYGTTYDGGNGFGTVFQLTPSGTLTTLYVFLGYSDGANPTTNLVQGPDGYFYGTTAAGGITTVPATGNGTIYKISPTGDYHQLYAFSGQGALSENADGSIPYGGLVLARDGNFYGTAYTGGVYGNGTVYRITPSGTFTTIHSFENYKGDGDAPVAGLIQASDGNFYGTTTSGGRGSGTIYQINLNAINDDLTVIYYFSGSGTTDGANPFAPLIQGKDGYLYGVACKGGQNGAGTIFRVTLDGTTFTTLHSFAAATWNGSMYFNADGADPTVGLFEASNGCFYGVTTSGGTTGYGTIFCINPNPTPTISGLSPTSTNAGGPDFTLSVKGNNFTSGAVVDWTAGTSTTALATTYVSVSQLKAAVPASLIANAGTAKVSINITGAGTSASKTFTVLLTTLKLTAANLTKNNNGTYTANITLKNIGYLTASNVTISKATLGAAPTSTTLPVTAGSITAGSTGSTSLTFPASAGTSGTVVDLKISGSFTGGKFAGSLKVTLP